MNEREIKHTKKHGCFYIITYILSLLNLIIFFSIRSMWSGIMDIMGDWSPYLLFAFLLFTALASYYFVRVHKKLFPAILAFIIDLLFLCLEGYIIWVALDSYHYFIREFCHSICFVGIIGLIYFMIFGLSKTFLGTCRWFRPVFVCLFLLGYTIWHFSLYPNALTSIPAVYAVEDTYQIVFTSRVNGTGWVLIGDKRYEDTKAGSIVSDRNIHKITVPMEVLDEIGSYTVGTKAMYIKGPYCALHGSAIEKTYDYRGVQIEDGLQYYVVSDTHTARTAPYKAASYFGDSLDFLICDGDMANWLDEPSDMNYQLSLIGKVTGGEIPVISARGNHELRGNYASQLSHYTASMDGTYYYTFRLKNLWGVVLDFGEDREDDYKEYFGTADYDEYRREQTAFLDSIIENAENEYNAEGIDFRIAVCHVPITIKESNDPMWDIKDDWTDRLNQMHLNALYSGHRHELMVITEDTPADIPLRYTTAYLGEENSISDLYYITAANFPTYVVSRKSDVQALNTPDDDLNRTFTGLAVSMEDGNSTMQFTNQDGEVLTDIVAPFTK